MESVANVKERAEVFLRVSTLFQNGIVAMLDIPLTTNLDRPLASRSCHDAIANLGRKQKQEAEMKRPT
jgi:hypothetical protein